MAAIIKNCSEGVDLMRITQAQADMIRKLLQDSLGEESKVWLFGSRVNDEKRGGDVDLYVETMQPCDLPTKLSLMSAIQRSIGLRKVDLLIRTSSSPERAIYATAKSEGVRL